MLADRYELVDGAIRANAGQNRPHVIGITLLLTWLSAFFGAERVQIQGPIDVRAEDNPVNEPEPDGAVLRRPVVAFTETNPGPDDLLLVV